MKSKIIFSIAIALLSFLMVSGTALADTDPIPIYNLEDLMNIGKTPENLSKNYILMADINVGSEETDDLEFSPIGTSSHNRHFGGTFDGNNHTISNITFSRNRMDYVGLFGYTKTATISDLSLKNVDFIGDYYVGALVGRTDSTNIINCSVSNSDDYIIFGRENVGGLIGLMEYSSVFNCSANSYVQGNYNVGGLIGNSKSSPFISDSSAVGNVIGKDCVGGLVGSLSYADSVSGSSATGNIEGSANVGGLIGLMDRSNVSDSYAVGTVNNNLDTGSYIGGFIGVMSRSSVSGSYATGDVGGRFRVGGFSGLSTSSNISDSYAIGTVKGSSVSGEDVGGFIGSLLESDIICCHAAGNVEGVINVGGFVGYMEISNVSESYAAGLVKSSSNLGEYTGGFVGYLGYYSNVSKSYAVGNVEGFDSLGGFVGCMMYSNVSESYAVGNVDGGSNIGGFIGSGEYTFTITDCFYIGTPSFDDQTLGIFVASDELKQISTFRVLESGGYVSKSWNISPSPNSEFIWYIDEGNSYPQFFRNYVPPESLPELLPESPVIPPKSNSGGGYGKAEIVDSKPAEAEKPVSRPEQEIVETSDSLPESDNPETNAVEKIGQGGASIFLIGLFLLFLCILIIVLRRRNDEDED